MSSQTQKGMTAARARRLEFAIIGLCVVALVSIFQPFSHLLFSAGCVGVVVAGLAFNLMPFCRPGVSLAKVGQVAVIVLVIFAVVVALALASAWGYSLYLKS
ncbi:hypothetical protein [Roseibium sp.]|uniref:hypothetical protein n=1 Tax=Roseibium sp. TaxID=1936156 RepID=UPI003B522E83